MAVASLDAEQMLPTPPIRAAIHDLALLRSRDGYKAGQSSRCRAIYVARVLTASLRLLEFCHHW